MTVEVTVTNPTLWASRPSELAKLLGTEEARSGDLTIGEHTAEPPDPDQLFTIVDPAY